MTIARRDRKGRGDAGVDAARRLWARVEEREMAGVHERRLRKKKKNNNNDNNRQQ